MNNPVIAITGASGFVGSALAEYLAHKGFRVVSLTRTSLSNYEHRYYDLERSLSDGLLRGIDVLIHCAFIKSEENPNAKKLNHEGTKNLLAEAAKCGVKKRIFFSTVSAHENAISDYGKSKFSTEQLFETSDAILQCSLIIGDGGIFKRLLDHTLSLRIIPLLNNGSQPLQVIAIEDVLKSVLTIITNNFNGRFILTNDEELTYRQFFRIISKVYKQRTIFIPISINLLKVLSRIANAINIKLPFNIDQIYGLQALQKFDSAKSLAKLNLTPIMLEEKLKQLKKGSMNYDA